jgi:hypothetical protein
MTKLEQIQDKIRRRQYEFSRHAVDQSLVRRITVAEVEQATRNQPAIVEDYPQDKYGPSCLLLGFTDAGRPLHIQISYPSRPLLKIITMYEPDSREWIGLRIRRTD